VLLRGLEGLDLTSSEERGWRGSLLQNLANTLADLGHFDAAEAAMRESVSLKTSAYGPESRLAALAHAGLGDVLFTVGKREESLVEYEVALAVYTRLGDDALMADALADIALVLGDDSEQAVQHLRRAEELVAGQPDAWSIHSQVLLGRSSLAEQRGNWAEAIRLAVAAAEVAAAHAEASPLLAAALGVHGRLLWHAGEDDESLRLLRLAHDTYCRTGDVAAPAAARVQGNLGYYGFLAGMAGDEALQHLHESLRMLQASLPADHVSVHTAEVMLAQVLNRIFARESGGPDGGTTA
jgi:tetratricopeptide (TPR) repeat protein